MKQIAVVVDMQYDFLIGGRLYVYGSKDIQNNIFKICDQSEYVIGTRDWHPHDHSSFKKSGGEWPVHCVAGTHGADIPPSIDSKLDVVFSKGQNNLSVGYSAAENPAFIPCLSSLLSPGDLVVVCGVALDYCVMATAISIAHVFESNYVKIPENATASVSKDPLNKLNIIQDLEKRGIIYERVY